MTCSMQLLPPYMEIGVSDTHRLARRPGTALVRRGGRPDTVVDRHNGAAGRHVRGRCCARSTAAKYSRGAVLRRSAEVTDAALTCSRPVGDILARGSGRRVDGTVAVVTFAVALTCLDLPRLTLTQLPNCPISSSR